MKGKGCGVGRAENEHIPEVVWTWMQDHFTVFYCGQIKLKVGGAERSRELTY
jgi:hypothetical protein